MKLMKKIGIFVLVVFALSTLFSICVSADSQSETNEIVYSEVEILDVSCPECGNEDGLKFKVDDEGKGYYACQNKDCGYGYAIQCSVCHGEDFRIIRTAESKLLYECQGKDCTNAMTLTEVRDSLVVTQKPSGGKLDMNLGDPDKEELNLTFAERIEYALQGTVTGMLMVFSVLTLLALIVSISKIVFYTIPQKRAEKKEKARQEALAKNAAPAEPVAPVTPAPVAETQDDGELAAVITAAIAAMIDSSEYKNEFVGGFRVVSFKRSTQSAWNRK